MTILYIDNASENAFCKSCLFFLCACVCIMISPRAFYRTHMQNIKDITSSIHYEMYRVRRLNENNMQANGLSEHHPASHEI